MMKIRPLNVQVYWHFVIWTVFSLTTECLNFWKFKNCTVVAIDIGTSGTVSSQAPTTEMLTNNVESFSGKEGKNRNFRGPSDGGGVFGQVTI